MINYTFRQRLVTLVIAAGKVIIYKGLCLRPRSTRSESIDGRLTRVTARFLSYFPFNSSIHYFIYDERLIITIVQFSPIVFGILLILNYIIIYLLIIIPRVLINFIKLFKRNIIPLFYQLTIVAPCKTTHNRFVYGSRVLISGELRRQAVCAFNLLLQNERTHRIKTSYFFLDLFLLY